MTVTVTSALAGPATARYSNVYGALVDLGVLSGLGAQDVTGSGDPVAPILNASEFYAPLTHSLVLTRGTGSATFTRATKAWEFGYSAAANSGDSQVLMEIASGTPRFGGARYDSGTWYNTYADGSAISASSLLGYHSEGARTNNLRDSRDLTNAAWVKTNITAVLTATGIDNAANSASTLTAGAADATILQTISMAAAARSFSAYVKRRTGTGNVYMTRDGGTNWTDITASLGASWTRVKIENTSVLNPSIGFKIETSGDAIDVDCVQDEAGAFISSPIVTTTAAVTRNADILQYAIASNFADAAGAAIASANKQGTGALNILAVASSSYLLNSGSGNDSQVSYDLTNVVSKSGSSTLNRFAKHGVTWSGSTTIVALDGASQSGSYDGSWNAGAYIDVGHRDQNSSTCWFGYIKNAYIWQSALTDAQLQQVTS